MKEFNVGVKNVFHEPLVFHEDIVFAPLNITLGVMKQSDKALNKEGESVKYICAIFHPWVTKNVASLTNGIYKHLLKKSIVSQKKHGSNLLMG